MRKHECNMTVSMGQGSNVKCGEVFWGDKLIVCIKCQGEYYGFINGAIYAWLNESYAEEKAKEIYGDWK